MAGWDGMGWDGGMDHRATDFAPLQIRKMQILPLAKCLGIFGVENGCRTISKCHLGTAGALVIKQILNLQFQVYVLKRL